MDLNTREKNGGMHMLRSNDPIVCLTYPNHDYIHDKYLYLSTKNFVT